MTLFLAICLLMTIVGAAFIGWILRWNAVYGDDPVDPRELGRRDDAGGMTS